jgi:hypothetical protein
VHGLSFPNKIPSEKENLKKHAETAIFSVSKKKKVCEEIVERPRLVGEKMMACQLLLFC